MKAENGHLRFSPSDLSNWVECEHLTRLEATVARGERARPEHDDPQADLVRRKGEEHEDAYLARLRDEGRAVATIEIEGEDGEWDWDRAARETEEAIRAGRDVIYQAALVDGAWRGMADFLERQPDGGYEVVDTKLGRHAKPTHLLQLCFYTSVVARLQGRVPGLMHLELGSGERESFPYAAFDAYYRRLRARFEAFVAGDAETYPWPVAHCGVCGFQDVCKQRWSDDDALVQVANIRRKQIERLAAAGVTTLAGLAHADGLQVPRITDDALDTLRSQAALQLHHRETGEHRVEHLPTAGKRGFALLPGPDRGDVYFDIEGDPFYSTEGSLEYLFGVAWEESGEHRFRAFWAHSADEEQAAFEALVDWVVARRARFPGMHVYHYANYERAALQRLMQKHGTREDEIDDLLRGGILVDLYQVVRQAVRLSLPSYSLKEVEKLYFPERETDVVGGDQSTVVFERWLDVGDQALLDSIELYNRDDCFSTLELHAWLLGLRPDLPWAAPPDPYELSAEGKEAQTAREALQARLLAGAEEGGSRWLAAHLLDYHRRDAKPAWWEYFRRLRMDERELLEDDSAIGGLEQDATVEPYPEKKSLVYELTFPPQDQKLGAEGVDPLTERRETILDIDEERGRLRLKRGKKFQAEPLPRGLVPPGPLRTWVQQDAVLRVVEAFAGGSPEYRAAQDVLTRAAPRAWLGGTVVDAVCSLEESYLFVQGPPGSGKTYLGAEAAVELMRRGKRVGVTSLSHKAIHNFLDDVDCWARKKGVPFRGLKKCSDRGSTRYEGSDFVENSGDNAEFEGDSDHDLIAGTSWLFAREGVRVDTLFVDEAGQVALADVLAMGGSAANLVLLGDPNQLPQVSQGAQPAPVRASVLEHLLGDATTIPPGRGLFLPLTYRLRPEICTFVSEAFYDGRLDPDPVCLRRSIDGHAGLRFVPVAHTGNRQSSFQEAEAVRAQIDGLLGRAFTDETGRTRPLAEEDILVVAAYNAQVRCLRGKLPAGVRVGTVDKFQGQQAPVVLFSAATSSQEELPRGLEFLFSPNRINVAVSRAQCLAVVVASPRLLEAACRTSEQMRLVNLVCRFAELSS